MNIEWKEVIVPIVQVVAIAVVPILLELLTGLGKMAVEYLRAKTKNALVLRFMSDLEAFAANMKNTFVDNWKAAAADGKITPEEVALLKQKAQVEIAKIIAHYPSELTGYLKDMADHYLESAVLKLANPTQAGSPATSEPPVSEDELANTEAS